ncbi:hypothetical protein [Pseudobutyrivibrio ruminis]|uniref:Uncharacterized protein n=1 Tax=Pseudobutyrivibrio ruminis DSM 9787 TaxID=1123011 RepID=A0A285T502_9FIRM|nr:hypothetical protein [Pseudobutyrivibrio ruminis]SOC16437.1 hypothetical protein SAMN02910411_0401 [Pseudobutyrivibrio ruminis DSM 9787]
MEQIKINKALYDAMEKDKYTEIKKLINGGANPLDSHDDRDLEDSPLAKFLFFASMHVEDNPGSTRITNMFSLLIENHLLDYIIYDEDGSDNLPLWDLEFCCSKDAAVALKKILDAGYTGLSVNELVEHFWTDLFLADFMEFEGWKTDAHIEWGIRMMMLVASYPEILDKNEYIQRCVELKENKASNISFFRNIDGYSIEYDEYTCVEDNKMTGLTVNMKVNNKLIWKIHM